MSMKSAQRAYDDMEPQDWIDPTEHFMFSEYLERHNMTLEQFQDSITEEQYFNWIEKEVEDFYHD